MFTKTKLKKKSNAVLTKLSTASLNLPSLNNYDNELNNYNNEDNKIFGMLFDRFFTRHNL